MVNLKGEKEDLKVLARIEYRIDWESDTIRNAWAGSDFIRLRAWIITCPSAENEEA